MRYFRGHRSRSTQTRLWPSCRCLGRWCDLLYAVNKLKLVYQYQAPQFWLMVDPYWTWLLHWGTSIFERNFGMGQKASSISRSANQPYLSELKHQWVGYREKAVTNSKSTVTTMHLISWSWVQHKRFVRVLRILSSFYWDANVQDQVIERWEIITIRRWSARIRAPWHIIWKRRNLLRHNWLSNRIMC